MIKGLLQWEAKDRLDAHQLINHPFVVNAPFVHQQASPPSNAQALLQEHPQKPIEQKKDCYFMEAAVDYIGKQQIQDAEKLKASLAAVE